MEKGAQVECYSGARFAERPVSFHFLGQLYVVEEVVKRWISPSVLHFRVRTTEGEDFELAYDKPADEWTIAQLAAGAADQ